MNCVWHRVKRDGRIYVIRRVEDKVFPGKAINVSPCGTGLGSRCMIQSLTHKMNRRWTGTTR